MDYKEKVLENKNITIKTEWNGGHIDYEVGNESTADGYDLWYFRQNGEQIDICENVYYYENGVIEALQDFIENHSGESITIADWCEITDDIDWDELAHCLDFQYQFRQNKIPVIAHKDYFQTALQNIIRACKDGRLPLAKTFGKRAKTLKLTSKLTQGRI